MQSTTVPTLQRFETGGVGVLPFIPQKARQQLTGANVQVLTPPDAPNCTGADLFYVGSYHTDNSIPPESIQLPGLLGPLVFVHGYGPVEVALAHGQSA